MSLLRKLSKYIRTEHNYFENYLDIHFQVPSFFVLKFSLSYFMPHSLNLVGSYIKKTINSIIIIRKKATGSGMFRLIPMKSSSIMLILAQFRHFTFAHSFPL